MSEKLRRCFSILLILALLLNILPTNILAAAIENSISSEAVISQDNAAKKNKGPTGKDVVGEDLSKRTVDTKHFRLVDGSYIAVQYETNVHYQDKNGKWQDINNKLLPEESLDTSSESDTLAPEASEPQIDSSEATAPDSTVVPEDQETDIVSALPETLVDPGDSSTLTVSENALAAKPVTNAYSVKDNNLKANFKANSGNKQDLIATNDKYSVSLSMKDAKKVNASIQEKKINNDGSLAAALELPNISSTIAYNGVKDGVDLHYTMYGNEIKEAIVVNAKQENYSYSFNMELGNLKPVENKDKSISLVDTESGEEVYLIPAPFMVDATGSMSPDVTYQLQKSEYGYTLTVTADKTWMNDSARQFPVTIDPTLVLTRYSDKTEDNLEVTYVSSGAPNTNHNGWSSLYLGYDSAGTYRNRILLRMTNLPSLPDNSVIVNASIYFAQKGYSYVGLSSMNVEAHALTSSVTSIKDATWNTQPTFNTEIADYTTISNSTTNSYVGWDLTRLSKDWYANALPNHGAVLMATNESAMSGSSCAKSEFYSVTNPPKYVIHYRNNVGLEDYYTYQSQEIGRAGTGYVSDHSAQLTLVKPDASMSGAIPYTLNHVYNSAYSHGNFSNHIVNTANYSNMLMGHGWKLNAQQSVVEKTITDVDGSTVTYLIYADGDGTEHYFSLNRTDGYYYDEDGLNLKIEKIVTTGLTKYVLTDQKGNGMEFHNGLLSVISDANGNKIYFIYNNLSALITGTDWYPKGYNDRLREIRQYNNGQSNYSKVATLDYDLNGYLKMVTDYAGNKTNYYYTAVANGIILTSVQHADGTTVSYEYNGIANANKMSKATDNEAKYSMNYGYNTSTRKLNLVREYGGANVGNYIWLNGNTNGITKYRDVGADRVTSTADDILTSYVFDNFGHTINSYSTDSSGKTILGATSNKYVDASQKPKQSHRIETTATIGTAAVNLLKYGGMEQSNWWVSGSGPSAQLSLSTDRPRTGLKSQKVTSQFEGSSKFVLQDQVNLTAGQKYTYSAYVNTYGDNVFHSSGGIFLLASDGNNEYTSDYFNQVTSETVDGGWKRVTLTFTPKVSGNHSFSICYTGFAGTVYADDAQLEKGDAPSNVNLVEDSGFESGYPWYNNAGSNVGYATDTVLAGAKSLKITGNPYNEYLAYQEVPINLLGKQQTFVLSGWGKANSVPTNQSGIKAFSIKAQIVYSDSTVEDHLVPFCSDTTEWQYVSSPIVPKQKDKKISYIRVYCLYMYNANAAYFDNISLVREPAQTFTYDENGKLTSVAATPETPTIKYTYNGANLLSSAETGSSGTYTYEYNSAHQVKSVSNSGLKMDLAYDGFGNMQSSVLSGAGTNKKITTSAIYSGNGNLLLSEKDSRENVTTYTYSGPFNNMTGMPSAVTNANQDKTDFYYNSQNGRFDLSAISGKVSVDPDYLNGNLSSITRGGFKPGVTEKQNQVYKFNYDEFGNATSVSVGTTAGDRTLATYTFAPANGLAKGTNYGNGASTSYTYDSLDRISTIRYDNGKEYQFTYTGDGQLYQVKSLDGQETATYVYDGIGRLIHHDIKNVTGVTQFRYSYDLSNRLAGFGYIVYPNIGEVINTYETYTYNSDGSIATKRTADGDPISITYEHLKRYEQRTVGTQFTVKYGYTYGTTSEQTTNLVNGIRYEKDGVALRKFGYDYDVLGNIKRVFDVNDDTEASYTYDQQNQVRSESLLGLNLTYEYEYDTYGNIRKVTAQPNGGTATSNSYSYDDPKWLDLLTAYNGNPITYDNIGNPLTYHDGTSFTWQNGRQLASLTKNGVNANYAYNSDGIRVQKAVNGVTHNYILDGSRILADLSEGSTLTFAYDENNVPQSFTYNGTKYFYITNLQGDVIEIRDSNNSVVGSYVYNAYGKIVSKSGPMAEINPLCYRGYYLDSETGFYYLNSRYYDPEIGRFINADAIIAGVNVQGFNLYSYCDNNPIMRTDEDGYFWESIGKFFKSAAQTLLDQREKNIKKAEAADMDLATTMTNIMAKSFKSLDWEAEFNRQLENVKFTNNYSMMGCGLAQGANIAKLWHKATFESVEESMKYHLYQHGKGRTIAQYTNDAMDFFIKHKELGKKVTLKDGSQGIRIKTGTNKNGVGGYWTHDGKLVTFWD